MDTAASNLFDPIILVAIDPTRNVRRRYEIAVARDLFGAFIVETRWGRIGARGQCKRQSFPDEAGARRQVAATMRRRRTAVNRIGVAYRPSPAVVPLTSS